MYQQFINVNRANQYQQECQREAATKRLLRAGGKLVDNRQGQTRLPWPPIRLRPALAWFICRTGGAQ